MNRFAGIRGVVTTTAFVLSLLPIASYAGGNPFDEAMSLGAILSYGVPTDPIHPGEWRVKVSPGYIINKDQSDSFNAGKIDMKGWGASAAVTRGLSDHWGAAFVVGGNAMTGRTPVTNSMNDNINQNARTLFGLANAYASGETSSHGVLAAASLIWDYWTGDGFRLPILVGLGYLDMTETSDYKAGGAKVMGTLSSPSVYLGIVPQFNVWKVRVAPFVTFSDALSASHVKLTSYNPSTGATIKTLDLVDSVNSDNRQTHTLGVAFNYIPWGLGFTYIPNTEGITAYTITYNRKFGGALN